MCLHGTEGKRQSSSKLFISNAITTTIAADAVVVIAFYPYSRCFFSIAFRQIDCNSFVVAAASDLLCISKYNCNLYWRIYRIYEHGWWRRWWWQKSSKFLYFLSCMHFSHAVNSWYISSYHTSHFWNGINEWMNEKN